MNCHGQCQRYQDWRKEKDAENAWLAEQRPNHSEWLKKRQTRNIKRKARGYDKVSRKSD